MAKTATIAVAAFAAAGLLAGGLAGCAAKDTSPQTLSAADLQNKMMEQFADTSMPPKSVVCKNGLTLETGQTATCDVTLADSTGVEAVATVNMDSGTADYTIEPALTKDQVAQLITSTDPAMSATCDAGLPSTVGATVQCEATVNGTMTKRAVTVDGVDGLQIDTSVHRLWPKEQVQELLLQKLNADGKPVETVVCEADVVGKPGSAVECAAVTGSEKKGYVVTLTTIEQDSFDIDYTDAP